MTLDLAVLATFEQPILLAAQQQDAVNPFGTLFLPMIAVMLLAYFMLLRPQQTKQKQYQDFLENLKENDQVVTIGGVYGTVTNVQRDAKRVTIRVDDASGARVRVAIWAISHLASDEKEDQAALSEAKKDNGKKSGAKNKA